MAVRKIRNSWWIDIRANYVRYRKRSPENTHAGAEAYEATLRQKLSRGEDISKASITIANEHQFEQFAWKWFNEYVIPNNKYSERQGKKNILQNSIIPFFGNISIEKITSRDIERYKAQQLALGIVPKTLKNRLTILNKCLKTAYEWFKFDGTPPKIVWPKCPPAHTDYLSADECELLINNSEGIVRELLFTALRTGMRQGELKGLQWSSIDWQNRNIIVRHSRCDRTQKLVSPKSNRERYIPMDIDVYAILFKRKQTQGYVFVNENGQPFNARYMAKHITEACAKAGLRKIGWHTLRHTFASQLAMRGVPLNAVQALLGHSSITVTMRYAHLAPSTLRSAIDMLNPKSAQSTDFGHSVGNTWIEAQQRKVETPLPAKPND